MPHGCAQRRVNLLDSCALAFVSGRILGRGSPPGPMPKPSIFAPQALKGPQKIPPTPEQIAKIVTARLERARWPAERVAVGRLWDLSSPATSC